MSSPVRPPTELRLPVIPASLAAVLLLAASAHAWPFVERDTGSGTFAQSLDQPLTMQLDADRPLELFTGGPQVLQMAANASGLLQSSNQNLPLPDYDPYPNGLAQVRFGNGRGAVGDIDGDGDIDIVYSANLLYEEGAEFGNVRVVACRNDGNGNWTRLWQIKTTSGLDRGGAPTVRLADLDRDGDLDFIESSTDVRIRWNDGDGNHSTSTALTTGSKAAPAIEVADFDGNGWPDVAVFGDVIGLDPQSPLWLTGRLTLFWNDAGTFTSQSIHTVNTTVLFSCSGQADLDGDDRPDLLVVRDRFAGGSDLVWFRNTGSGFAEPVILFSNASQNSNRTIRFDSGDLDEDGVIDLVISTKPGEVQWLRGTGGGAFTAATVLRSSNLTGSASPLRVADLDGDGDLDILHDFGDNWLENRSIRMQVAASVTPWTGINPTGSVDLTVGDLNNDGKDDLVVADGGGTRIRWYPGTGSGLEVPSFVSTGNLQPLSVATGDFNGDGWTDLAWTTADTLRQAISTNGSGFSWILSTAANMSGITRIVPEDTDRDGDTDIVSISPSASIIRIHANNGSASGWLPQNVATGVLSMSRLATGQLIPGGRPEILTAGGVAVNRHRHTGTWTGTTLSSPSPGNSSVGVVIADVADHLPGMEAVFCLNSNSIFYDHDDLPEPYLIATTLYPVTQLAAVDWNRDGFTDIIAATTSGIFIYPHNGDQVGTFRAPLFLMFGTSIQDLVVMKLDGDAYPDAVASQSGTGQLHLISNQSAAVEVNASGYPTALTLPGAEKAATSLVWTHRGMRGQEQPCAPANLLLRFLRSAVIDGQDSPGTALTQSEVSALVEHVSLSTSGVHYQATSPTGVSGGIFNLPLSSATRTSLSLKNKVGRSVQLLVKLKATAGSSSVQRFYVEFSPAPSQWVELDDFGNSNPLVLRKRGTTDIQRTLFVVDTPGALENWRMTWFGQYDGSGIAANDHDADGDGLPNLVEYVASRNPTAATGLSELTKPLVMVTGAPGDNIIAEVRVLQSPDPNVRVRVQDSTTMQFWSNMSTRDGGGPWIGRTPTTTQLSGGRALYKFNTNISPEDEPKYFLRLVAEEIP